MQPSGQQKPIMTSSPSAEELLATACERLGLTELIGRMALGDESALGEYHARMADRLWSMALRMVPDRALAAEALQECLIRIWKGAARFDADRSEPFSWSVMILRGTCLDALRRSRRYSDRIRLHGEQQSEPAGHGLEDLYFRETLRTVRGALDQLGGEDRACLESMLFAAESREELAARLNTSPETLKVRLHRAMQRLRQLLSRSETL